MLSTSMLPSDPWSCDDDPPAKRFERSTLLLIVATTLLGGAGATARVWGHGATGQRAAMWLGIGAALLVLSFRLWSRWRRWGLVVSVLVVSTTAALVVPLSGRAPVIVMVLSVVCAEAALSGARPWASGATTRRTALLALPFVVSAQVLWFRTGSLVLVSALLASSVAAVWLYHSRPRPMRRLDAAFRRAVAVVADGIAGAMLLAFSVPLLYVPGVLVRGLRSLWPAHRRHGSTWRPVSASATQAVADAELPFIAPGPAVRRRRHVMAAGIVVAVLASMVGVRLTSDEADVLERAAPPTEEPGSRDQLEQLDLLEFVPYSSRPAMEGLSFANDLQHDTAEVTLRPESELGWVTNDAETRYVNVEGGERRTIRSACTGCPEVTAWMVGASVAFGVGQRDEHTVASELVRLAASDGVNLSIHNLGTVGWTSHQERIDLLRRIEAATELPDLVIVLDGFNDVMAAVAREFAGKLEAEPLTLDRADVAATLSADAPLTSDRVDAAARRAVDAYSSNQHAMQRALDEQGVPSMVFFQPDAFASTVQLEEIRELYDTVPSLLERPELDRTIRQVLAMLSDVVIDVRNTYASEPEPVFIDVSHTNERGAKLLAEAMYPSLAPRIEFWGGS